MKKKEINLIVKVGMLSAVAVILQYIGTAMGLKIGGFLDVEISDFPAIIGTLALGPVAGALTELIKNVFHILITTSGAVGELANFLVNGTFVLIIGIIYKKHKTKKGALISLICGIVSMCVMAVVANTFILLPLYMPTATMAARISIVLTLITPFNICRGAVLALLTLATYKPLSPILHK